MNASNRARHRGEYGLRAEGFVFAILAVAKVAIHLGANHRYGFHRDEFLYLAEARHLAWGFLEVPPFTPFLGALALQLSGGIQAVRFFPTLGGVVCLWAILAMTRALGGGRPAAWLAGLAFLASPVFLGSNLLFQPVSFNQMWWALLALAVVWVIRYRDDRYWYLFGIFLGLAWLTKYSVAVFGLSLFLGVLASSQRGLLASPSFWRALLLAGLLAAPNLAWQVAHDFPVLRHMEALRATQLVNVRWIDFLSYQFYVHAGGVIIWLAGLTWLLTRPAARPFRWMAYTWPGVILLFLLMGGKGYYAEGAYPMLFAAGGVGLSRWLAGRRAILAAVLALSVLVNVPFVPYALPVLPVERMVAYGQWMDQRLGFRAPLRWEDGTYRPLRQDYADMLGWEEMVRKTARLYHSLPPGRKERCLIWGGSYGHAGALLHYREKYGLPEPVSLNSSFALWAPERVRVNELILLDDRRKAADDAFARVDLVDSLDQAYARDPGYLHHLTQPVVDLQQAWQAERRAAQYWEE